MLGYLAGLTTTQIVIGLGIGFVLIWIAKIVFTKGGPRQRMKRGGVAWVVIPLLVAIGGGIAWLLIQVMGPTSNFHI
jgi:hypothetical protein